MPLPVLTLLKLALLALIYLFLYRVVRAVVADLYGERRRAVAAPRPPVAGPAPRSGRSPRTLVVHPPDGQPTVIALGRDTVTLGRSEDMTVALDDVYVSEEHALIAPNGEGYVVRDLGSTNGTYLNGAKVTAPTPIAAGDQLRIGKTQIEVRR